MILCGCRVTPLVVLIGALLILASCGEIDPEADPRFQAGAQPQGRILYVSNNDIYLWDGDTHRITNLGDASLPAWAPDGEQFLFVRTGDAYSDLALGNVSTLNVTRLTNNEPPFTPGTLDYINQVMWVLDPVWSRDGSGFAFVSDRGTVKNFLWYQPGLENDAVRVRSSTVNGDNVEKPDFSPDGNRVVYAQRTSSQTDLARWMSLWISDLITGELIELYDSDGEGSSFYPRWSPDGEWIAFIHRVDEQSNLWIVPADGGDPIQLTDEGGITGPAWSPDGQQIAFVRQDGGRFRVAYVDLTFDEDGNPRAGDVNDLFSADGIHAQSGLSWID
jgi:TolB protein